MNRKNLFTLIELIIVIAIIAVLAAIATLALNKWVGKARDSKRITDLATITKALNVYLANPKKWNLSAIAIATQNWQTLLTGVYFKSGSSEDIVLYQWPFDEKVLKVLFKNEFKELQKLPKDPNGQYYIISIDAATQKLFQVWATREFDIYDNQSYNATINWNFSPDIHTLAWNWMAIKVPSMLLSGDYNDALTGYFVSYSSWSALDISSYTGDLTQTTDPAVVNYFVKEGWKVLVYKLK